jgi:hypothetical protein
MIMSKNLTEIQKQSLLNNLKTTLLYTEHSGNDSTIYALSLAGGKSTYSFGLVQFDIGKNASVNGVSIQDFLRNELGFRQNDTNALHGNYIWRDKNV